MSVTVYGRYGDDAVFEDDNGLASVPLRALAMLHHAADRCRTEYATWQGPPVRRFHRDTLRAVLRDYEDDNLPELDSCATSGCDQPAPFVLAHTRPTCHDHAKDHS